MASKMSMRVEEDSLVGFNKRVANYTQDEYDSEGEEYEENDFYDNYEPYEEDFDNGDYQPFEEEDFPTLTKKQVVVRPVNLSPTKSAEKSPPKSPSWWDKSKIVDKSDRIIDGVLNYAALLPPPTPKPKVVRPPKKNKKTKDGKQPFEKKIKNNDEKNHPKSRSENNGSKGHMEVAKRTNLAPKAQGASAEVQKPTRLCLSVIRKTKCFHGSNCRFAHDYSDLKECNFGEKCKKIIKLKTNPDGTFELANRNEVACNFKHAKESKTSYMKRLPQQHTSPKRN